MASSVPEASAIGSGEASIVSHQGVASAKGADGSGGGRSDADPRAPGNPSFEAGSGGYSGGNGCNGSGFFAKGVGADSGPSGTTLPVETLTAVEVFASLADFRSLTRERALSSLRHALSAGRSGTRFSAEEVEPLVLEALHSDKWEARQGGLLAATEAVQTWDRPPFRTQLLTEVPQLLMDKEYRVRKAVASVLRECCRRDGLQTYDALKDRVLRDIKETFQRVASLEEEAFLKSLQQEEQKKDGASQNTAPPAPPAPPPAPTFLHDTEGWRTLETSIGVLEAMMQGCGTAFSPRVTDELLELLAECTRHTNRFVREYAFFALKDTFEVCDEHTFLDKVGPAAVGLVAEGIRDNWSQVRYAGSTAARAFMERAAEFSRDGDARERFYPQLLAPMCLNRHYVAEGVRLYSQETWKSVCGPRGGARLLMAHIDEVISEYCTAAKAPNHAVREAACNCISELAARVAGTPQEPSPFREHFTPPRIETLMDTLMAAFQDESWPVRDIASTAVGHFVRSFPSECAKHRSLLLELWFEQIQDNIPSLRSNGAAALCGVIVGPWSDLWEDVLIRLRELLPAAEKQADNSEIFTDYTPSGPFSVPRPKDRGTAAEDLAHTNKVMYSCGSLAPKTLKRRQRVKDSGCMNCTTDAPHQLWESAEGMAHLLSELSVKVVATAATNPSAGLFATSGADARLDELAALVPLLIRSFEPSHYQHSHLLKQRVCERLPALVESLRPQRVTKDMPQILRVLKECIAQLSHPLLHESSKDALLAWRRAWLPGEKAAVAASMGLDGGAPSLDAWMDKAIRSA
eukprot:TRINITY_DN3615_c0_g1_i1.p1 TRINITY_DN3615_c0_g1~~TRINITY_DN3615_c0_g1_i1.p1  ORF type:complete len:827 (-),score=154.80 TRINITY_DN3615_c0_g1_i1:44-2455(-)